MDVNKKGPLSVATTWSDSLPAKQEIHAVGRCFTISGPETVKTLPMIE